MSNHLPFDGLVVVDFTHVLAGPACSYYLGMLGAHVIKVESATKGDAIRHRGGTDAAGAAEGMSTSYLTQGAGKYAIALDLASAEGLEIMHRLLAQADVFVENHLPETLRALGLHEDTVCDRHPHLIYCAMTGYGRGGPQENAPAYDVNIQASCGIMEMTGTQESGPIRTGAPILDYGTALAAGFAVSAALYGRTQTGTGAFVDVSMLETGFALMSSTVTDYMKTGNEPTRRGNASNSRSPGAGSFPCKDGMISLGVNEESQFVGLAKALDREDWLTDPRYAAGNARKANAATLSQEVEAALGSKSAAEWEPILQQAGVPCARLRTMAEALSSEQAQKRRFVYDIPESGISVPTLPFRIATSDPYVPSRAAPEIGADQDAVMAWLREREERA